MCSLAERQAFVFHPAASCVTKPNATRGQKKRRGNNLSVSFAQCHFPAGGFQRQKPKARLPEPWTLLRSGTSPILPRTKLQTTLQATWQTTRRAIPPTMWRPPRVASCLSPNQIRELLVGQIARRGKSLGRYWRFILLFSPIIVIVHRSISFVDPSKLSFLGAQDLLGVYTSKECHFCLYLHMQ